jgi:hypothetical protein
VTIARQQGSKHISAVINKHTKTEGLLGRMFSLQSMLYNRDQNRQIVSCVLGFSTYGWWLVVNMETEESPLLGVTTKQSLVMI